MSTRLLSDEQRFWRYWRNVAIDDSCWEWQRARSRGYGRAWDGQRLRLATHLALELWTGKPVPAGTVVLHLCDNPPCVRPDHLKMGTQADNLRDARAKGRAVHPHQADKTHCPAGHPYDDLNTYRDPKKGRRHCRTCRRAESKHRRYGRSHA